MASSAFIAVFVTKKLSEMDDEKKAKELNTINQAINLNVFEGLLRKMMPDDIFYAIKSQIINEPLIRKNVLWIFDFKKNSEGNIELRQTLKSELHDMALDMYDGQYKFSYNTNSDASINIESVIYEMEGTTIAKTNSDDPTTGENIHKDETRENNYYVKLSIPSTIM